MRDSITDKSYEGKTGLSLDKTWDGESVKEMEQPVLRPKDTYEENRKYADDLPCGFRTKFHKGTGASINQIESFFDGIEQSMKLSGLDSKKKRLDKIRVDVVNKLRKLTSDINDVLIELGEKIELVSNS